MVMPHNFELIVLRTWCSFCATHSCIQIFPNSQVVGCIKCRAVFDGTSQAKEEEFYKANKLDI